MQKRDKYGRFGKGTNTEQPRGRDGKFIKLNKKASRSKAYKPTEEDDGKALDELQELHDQIGEDLMNIQPYIEEEPSEDVHEDMGRILRNLKMLQAVGDKLNRFLDLKEKLFKKKPVNKEKATKNSQKIADSFEQGVKIFSKVTGIPEDEVWDQLTSSFKELTTRRPHGCSCRWE